MSQVTGCEKCSSDELKDQVQALKDLIGVAQASVSSLELDNLLHAILESAMGFTQMPVGRVALYDKRTGKLNFRAYAGQQGSIMSCDWVVKPGSQTDHLLRRNEIFIVEDTCQTDLFSATPAQTGEGIRSQISIPLVTKQAIHGLLCLDDFVPRSFDKNRMSLVSVMASFAAMSIENAKLHKETHKRSIMDSLTGLYNRHYLNIVLPQELERARRHGQSFSLVLIDVDNFKKFNDTYGHPLGDRVLAAIGRVLLRMLRTIDFAFRYGGEEFMVLLPATSLKSTRKVAERIRQRVIVEGRKLLRNTTDELVTVSMGIACYPRDAVDAETLISAADQLLYKAKGAGRNRILTMEEDIC